MPTPTLAIAMIVKNEAQNLDACLQSCHQLADEIVIVDSGSQDGTLEIAHKYANVRVVEHHDWKGFGPQRQVAQQHVRAKWVFWIDADERITEALAHAIRNAVSEDRPDAIYSVSRLSWVFGRFIRHSGWYPDRVARLYPTSLTGYSDDPVHESVRIPPNTPVIKLQGDLLHFTYRDLQHYLVKSAHYASLWAEQRHTKAKRASLTQGIVHALGCFFKMYIVKAGFLDGRQGLLLALLSAHSTFAKYADLWIRRQALAVTSGKRQP